MNKQEILAKNKKMVSMRENKLFIAVPSVSVQLLSLFFAWPLAFIEPFMAKNFLSLVRL